jgi:hypothetical protein
MTSWLIVLAISGVVLIFLCTDFFIVRVKVERRVYGEEFGYLAQCRHLQKWRWGSLVWTTPWTQMSQLTTFGVAPAIFDTYEEAKAFIHNSERHV